MKLRFKISVPTKRDIEKLLKGKNRGCKKKRKTIALGLFIIILLLGFLFLYTKNEKRIRNFSPSNKEDSKTIIAQEIAYRSSNPYEWLTASTNIEYETVYDLIVLSDNSEYSKLASKKERREWLEEYLSYFGWIDNETGDSNEPEMLSLSSALEVGKYCGLSDSETMDLLENR